MRLEITALSNQCSELKTQNETLVKTIENQATMLESKSGTDSPFHQPSPVFCTPVHNSMKTVMQEEKVKNDVIIAKVQEKNDDVTMVTSLCDKIGFRTKPVDVKRIEKRLEHSSYANAVGKPKTEQDAFKRNNDLVYKMNQKLRKTESRMDCTTTCGKRDNNTRVISTSDEETPKGDFSGLYLNARSIDSVNRNRNKIAELRNLVSSHEPQILAVCETWLSTNIDDNWFRDYLPGRYQKVVIDGQESQCKENCVSQQLAYLRMTAKFYRSKVSE
ncbi:hypothetical protein CAPTEDRAFT_211238 [Capitella teleta]|uniref:Uncharacterized protein n=1 Tax=Capitella teleta TaxID=283909 RepID=R7UYV7_CAPTE|nr:hypothetical protein CAPTEDRAFT_211238 [Capitella teleta]|eukprot:ELU08576.1 hypothetical protein CAPTEDRAFT_211238 [Capitella teleta]